MHPAKAELP